MSERYYVCDKENKELVYGYIDYHELNKGFTFKPQNKVPYDGVEVSDLVLVKPSLIKKVLKKKTKKKLDAYFVYLLSILNDDEEEGEGQLIIILDDIERYKNLIINKYSKFLGKTYITNLLKKVNVIEKNFKERLDELVETKNHHRGSR